MRASLALSSSTRTQYEDALFIRLQKGKKDNLFSKFFHILSQFEDSLLYLSKSLFKMVTAAQCQTFARQRAAASTQAFLNEYHATTSLPAS
mmetsp:Transcript_20125/g.49912  ORF Transcript_20125/g.49912 Transcript_20125/m.49912 type:complete len:91 (+) Transcript_20125:63-335(+)